MTIKDSKNQMFIAKKQIQIKALAGITIFVLLAGVVGNTLPNYAAALQDNDTNSTDTQPEPVEGNESSANETNVGDQVSEFVHNAIQDFKQQRMEIIDAIHQCHAQIANATASDRAQIMDSCKANVRIIHDKYSDERTKYHELFKQFRENILPFVREAKGLHVDANETKAAVSHIMDTRQHMIKEGKKDVLQGINDVMKGNKMINSGHPMMGKMEIEKGKTQMREGKHDIKSTK